MRILLALLVLRLGQVVPLQVIIEELWPNTPCRSAAVTVRTYVLGLRKLIDETLQTASGIDSRQVLTTVQGGYCLERGRVRTDVTSFDSIAATGHSALLAGDYQAASTKLDAALRLWRGPALVDVRGGPRLDAEARRLEESRMVAVERRIEADLHAGRHDVILSELTGLTSEHPFHERLHGQLMLALYRCERRADALMVFYGLRVNMVEKLGLEPSRRLAELQHSILTSNPELEWDGYANPRAHAVGSSTPGRLRVP
jgi:DNA-binding SARP family transcriptional activator